MGDGTDGCALAGADCATGAVASVALGDAVIAGVALGDAVIADVALGDAVIAGVATEGVSDAAGALPCWRISSIAPSTTTAPPSRPTATIIGLREPVLSTAGVGVMVGAWMDGVSPICRSACAFFNASSM